MARSIIRNASAALAAAAIVAATLIANAAPVAPAQIPPGAVCVREPARVMPDGTIHTRVVCTAPATRSAKP